MSRIYFFIIFTCYFCAIQGQNITVLFADDKKPVPFALITRTNRFDKTTQSLYTDASGNASFPKSAIPFIYLVEYADFESYCDSSNGEKDLIFYIKPALILQDIVITAQFAPESKEKSVHKVTVIDRKKIDFMAAQNLRDVLSNELNIRLSQDNILGSGLSLQGISGQNVKILIDGVPVIGRLNGNIDISQIQLNNIEKIEIVEGPLSVKYGTDALAGTINLISKKTLEESVSLHANSFYESVGNYNFSLKSAAQKGKNVFGVFVGRNYFDGWVDGEKNFKIERKSLADNQRFKTWKPKEQRFGTFYFNRNIKELSFNYTTDLFNEEIMNRGLPRLPYAETAFDDYYKTLRFNNTLNISGKIHDKFYTSFIFANNYFRRIKNTYFKDLTNLSQLLTENSGDQDTTKINLITSRASFAGNNKNKKLGYEVGYDISYEIFKALRIKDSQQNQGDFAVFSSIEYKPIAKITLRPGIRLIYNTVYKAPIVPSFNVRYGFKPNHVMRASYARGFRAPELKELYFLFVDLNHNIEGNPTLIAEKSNNFSFSYVISKNKEKLSWKFENSFFYNQIQNRITLAQLRPNVFSYLNLEQFQSLGGQFNFDIWFKNIRFQAGASYIGQNNQLTEEKSTKFDYSPELKMNVNYEIAKTNTSISVFYKYTGKMPNIAINEKEEIFKYTTQDYQMADVSINQKFFNKNFTVSIGSKNIFNIKSLNGFSSGTHNSAGNLLIGYGRTYFLKLDYHFSLKK